MEREAESAEGGGGVAVVVCAHDEEDRIGATVSALRDALPGVWVLVVDDGSSDATAQVAGDHGAEVLSTGTDIGKGAAATLGARAALARGPAVVLLCDGDLGDSARHLATLVATVGDGGADLAVAHFARRIGGGFGIAVGYARRVLRRRTGRELRAPISGQRALTAAALGAVLPFAEGFGMELGMTIDADRAGLRLVEVELPLEHRATGRTPAGFLHRGRQLRDLARAARRRRRA